MILEVQVPAVGEPTNTVTTTEEQKIETMLAQMLCPNCGWGPFESKQLLATHRFNAHGITASRVRYKQTDHGTFSCPDCGRDDFRLPLLVGKHRHDVHGYTSPYRVKVARKKKSKAIAVHNPPAQPTFESPSQGTSPSVLYMYARVEAQCEAYAKDNGLVAKTFIASVAELLLGAVA